MAIEHMLMEERSKGSAMWRGARANAPNAATAACSPNI